MKHICNVCGWIYDDESGCEVLDIPEGTKWEDLDEDFQCPMCGVGKDEFSEI